MQSGSGPTPGVSRRGAFALAAVAVVGVAACTPTVRVVAPDKPITINLNVKIDQEVRVKLDREIEDLIAKNPDVFG
ncbi:YnbE family lipoprotein [bacterium]|nr:YnbE family lipoprotein [bacterium]